MLSTSVVPGEVDSACGDSSDDETDSSTKFTFLLIGLDLVLRTVEDGSPMQCEDFARRSTRRHYLSLLHCLALPTGLAQCRSS